MQAHYLAHAGSESGNIESAVLEEVSMKMCSGTLSVLLLGCTFAQTQSVSPQTVPDQQTDRRKTDPAKPAAQSSNVDPAKAADIKQLMELAGVKAIMIQSMQSMGDSMKPLLTNALPPGEYRARLVDLFFVKFKSKADTQQLLDSIVPLYDKYLSDEEIKALIQFYQTPLGQKTIQVMPKLTAESQEVGRKWGEGLGRQSMLDVLAEHPELEKALEDAKKNPPPQ
jgi:hypothetical protein